MPKLAPAVATRRSHHTASSTPPAPAPPGEPAADLLLVRRMDVVGVADVGIHPHLPVRDLAMQFWKPFGGIIGWGLDTLFGTFPTFFLIMLFVGFGVGVVNVMRISKTPPGPPGASS